MRYLAVAALGSLLVLLSGCGQKGDLYLPQNETTPPAVETQPQPEIDEDDTIGRDPVNVETPPL